MNLVWHIAKKDLRRMAIPVALWCVPVVGRVVLPWLVLGSVVADAAAYRIWGSMVTLLLGMDVVIEAILVAALVQEDVPSGTTAWWPTRPIAGGRLLLAKLLSGVALFLVVPLVPLSIAWLTAGFSAREWLAAVTWFAITRGLIALVALGLAVAAENLVQFLFGAILISFGFVLLASYADFGGLPGLTRPTGAIMQSGREWMGLVALACPTALLVHQYLTRRRERTLVILGAGLALIFGIRFVWAGHSFPISRLIDEIEPPFKETAENQAVKLADLSATSWGDGSVALKFSIVGMPPATYASPKGIRGDLGGDGAGRIVFVQRGPPRHPADVAISAVAGLAIEPANEMWTATGHLPPKASQFPAGLSGRIGIRWMRGRLVGEFPLRPGAELRMGSNVTRLIDLRQEDENFVVTLAERDALPPRKYWPDIGNIYGRDEIQDFYVLLDHGKRVVQILPAESSGLSAGTMLTGQRRLSVPLSSAVPGWDQGAVLLKVRFELDHYFIRPFTVERITTGS